MKKTVIGVFDHFQNAERVVAELTAAGAPREGISVITPGARGRPTQRLPRPSAQHPDGKDELTNRVGAGAAVGGAGGLLLSLAGAAIPGIGPILSAGPLLAAIGGAAAGGLVGALSSAGVAHEDAHFYAEALRRGSSIVSVDIEEAKVEQAAAIMNRFGSIDIDKRSTDYRAQGFSGFDATRPPLTRDELIAEREPRGNTEARTGPAEPDFHQRTPTANGGVRVITPAPPPAR